MFSPATPSLADTVRTLDIWAKFKVEDKYKLAHFHKRYWGKSIEDDDVGRHINAQESDSQLSDNEQEGDQVTANSGESPAVVDDDIIPGRSYLQDVFETETRRIWIRAEYIRLYDYCKVHYATYSNNPDNKMPSVVLTGNPGIGKSLWIQYAARRCAAEKNVFIWGRGAIYFLFVDEGVYNCLPNGMESASSAGSFSGLSSMRLTAEKYR